MASVFDLTAPATPDPAAAPSDSGGGSQSVFSKLGGAAMGAAGVVGDILGRPGMATQAAIAGGITGGLGNALSEGGRTFLHSETPDDIQAHRDTIKSAVGAKDLIDRLPAGLARGTADFGIDTLLDPTTYLGGLGLIEKGVNAAGRAAAVGAFKNAGQAIPRVGLGVSKVLGSGAADAAQNFLSGVGNVGAKAFDVAMPKGDAFREAVRTQGTAGIKTYNTQRTAYTFGRSRANDIENAAKAEFKTARTGVAANGKRVHAGLSDQEESDVYGALNDGNTGGLNVQQVLAHNRISNTTDAYAHLMGTQELRDELARNGFQLPDWAKKFDNGTPRDIMSLQNYRKNYLPLKHVPGANADEAAGNAFEQAGLPGRVDLGFGDETQADKDISQAWNDLQVGGTKTVKGEPVARNPLSSKDAFLKPRTGEGVVGDNELQRDVFNRRLQSGARAMAGKDVSDRLVQDPLTSREILTARTDPTTGEQAVVGTGKRALTPATKRFFAPPKVLAPEERGALQQFGAAVGAPMRGFMNELNQGFFLTPFAHMANITNMAALADPIAAAQGFGRAMGATRIPGIAPEGIIPGARASQNRAIAAAEAAGATTIAPEREPGRVISAIAKSARNRAIGTGVGAAGGAASGFLANPDDDLQSRLASAGAGAATGAALLNRSPELYRWSGKTLWGFEDAMKATRYDRLLKQGFRPSEAAARTGGDMLDYGLSSPLTRGVGAVAPFATFRTKMPGAILRGAARHPERILAMQRASAGTLTGDSATTDDGGTIKSYLPTADVLRAFSGPKGAASYVRSTLGAPSKDLITALAEPAIGAAGRYMTYGNPLFGTTSTGRRGVVPSQLVGSIPGADQMLSAGGLNPYANRGLLQDLLSGWTRMQYLPPAGG